MDAATYASLSATGKVVYTNLCLENYALTHKPNADWETLFKKTWELTTGVYWDEWAYSFMCMIPEYLTEFPDYESSDFEHLTKQDYEALLKLYEGMPDEWGKILDDLYEIALALGYDCDDPEGRGKKLIKEIEAILVSENIPLPTEDVVALCPSIENRGYGNPFDGRKVSHVLS